MTAAVEAALKLQVENLKIALKQERYRAGISLNPAKAERLYCLMEECAEVIQACSKILRFGADDMNQQLLEKEMGDLKVATGRVLMAHDARGPEVKRYAEIKKGSVSQYLKYNS